MELNREQIIKGLECCKWDDISLCKHCPYYKPHKSNCISEMSRDAISLINELTVKTEAQDIIITELWKKERLSNG